MWRAAAETQKSVLDLVQTQMGQAKDQIGDNYAFTAQTSQDATRMATEQLSAAAKHARDMGATQERKAQEQRKSV